MVASARIVGFRSRARLNAASHLAIMNMKPLLGVLLSFALVVSGRSQTPNAVVGGSLVGALVGGIVGHNSAGHDTGKGALVGAGIGAVVGAVAGQQPAYVGVGASYGRPGMAVRGRLPYVPVAGAPYCSTAPAVDSGAAYPGGETYLQPTVGYATGPDGYPVLVEIPQPQYVDVSLAHGYGYASYGYYRENGYRYGVRRAVSPFYPGRAGYGSPVRGRATAPQQGAVRAVRPAVAPQTRGSQAGAPSKRARH